ncbi:MAG TPA: 2Fe-2S iron-sulfur cluster binding domain-containing protein [Syntrophomonadaceae bacterium]|nr:2Fe-2S iron-sulfur cluster binding domain-containing protein [Syntrophomonadaceae bacterium]
MKIKIDGIEVDVISGETILEAARRAGIHIPTLCYHEAFGGQGICRMCIVEVKEGNRTRLVASCTYPVNGEIEVKTSTPEIERIRRNIVMLLYRRAPNSEFMKKLYEEYGRPGDITPSDPEESCIMCRLCVRACEKVGANAISAVLRGTEKRVSTPYDEPSPDCIGCCACAQVCPTGTIRVSTMPGKYEIWNKAFEMDRCESCSRPFVPQVILEHVRSKLGPDFTEEHLCPDCRKKKTGKIIADSHLSK